MESHIKISTINPEQSPSGRRSVDLASHSLLILSDVSTWRFPLRTVLIVIVAIIFVTTSRDRLVRGLIVIVVTLYRRVFLRRQFRAVKPPLLRHGGENNHNNHYEPHEL